MAADPNSGHERCNQYRLDELSRHPWLRDVRYFPSIASTNDWALRHVSEARRSESDANRACGIDADTSDAGAIDTNASDTSAIDAGAIVSNAIDTSAIDTGAIVSNASDTSAIDTGASDTVASDASAIDANASNARVRVKNAGVRDARVMPPVSARDAELGDHAVDPRANLAQPESVWCPRPVLVLAGEQTAGRGRGANRWWSATGSLTFSLILELPEWLPAGRRSELALVAGLAVRRTVSDGCHAPVMVKWPNDVYVGERKIAGILIETIATRPPRIVLGIGLNVNNSLADAPADVQARATSLIDWGGGRPRDRTATLVSLIDALRGELTLWLNAATPPGDEQWLAQRWRPYCFLAGRTVRIDAAGKGIAGKCLGVSNAGELLVRTEDGGTIACRSGVVASYDAL